MNVKFDILNREILEFARTYGCKILHLSSHVFEEDRIAIEGPNGLIEYLSIDQLRTLLEPHSSSHLEVDLVVLAVPQSHKLAQVFLSLGVRHVISFGYDQFLRQNTQYLYPKIQNMIYNFCVRFYSQLLKENTVISQAFEFAVNQTFEVDFEDIMIRYKDYEAYNGREVNYEEEFKLMENGPRLQPTESVNHNSKIFAKNPS